PLEALIDPISVLNRSNWGQVYEALAGAVAVAEARPWLETNGGAGAEALRQAPEGVGCEGHGRRWVPPPLRDAWLREPVPAVVGVQFIMRLPHHARDRLSGGHPVGSAVRVRPQRFGEMDHWAAWAHGAASPPPDGASLTPAVGRLARFLQTAGYN